MMKKKFKASVWKEDKWFVAQCLEVNIASQGKTEKKALENLADALELYFEDSPAKVPSAKVKTIEVEISAA